MEYTVFNNSYLVKYGSFPEFFPFRNCRIQKLLLIYSGCIQKLPFTYSKTPSWKTFVLAVS